MEIVYGLLALAGFFLSVAEHVYALRGVDIFFPYVSLLEIGVALLFMLLVASAQREFGGLKRFSQIKGILPKWAVMLETAVVIYVFVMFLFYLITSDGMSTYISGGNYFVKGPGYPSSVVTEVVYKKYEAARLAGTSGHLIFFYLSICLYFLFRKNRRSSS